MQVSDISNEQVELGDEATTYEEYKPLELCKIGDYQDYFTKGIGKNLLDTNISTQTKNGVTLTNNGDGTYILNGTATGYGYFFPSNSNFQHLKAGTYTFSANNYTDLIYSAYYDNSGTALFWKSEKATCTLNEDTNDFRVQITTTSGKTYNNVKIYLQLESGTSQTYYEPYNSKDKWCKYTAIGKVVLDGSENWYKTNDTTASVFALANFIRVASYGASGKGYSNYYTYRFANTSGKFYYGSYNNITLCQDIGVSLADFKTWLGTHNTICYYVLETPYLSLIEDTTLIEQLDTIEGAFSYEGTTNVNQINNDLPFIMDLKAMKKDTNETIVNNIGNTTSKPTIALEGTGDINIYLNGTQMLKATLTDKMTIDTTNLEAYNPDTMTLLNRHLVGDISKFTLNSGENTIKMDGDLTKATITDYTRYL
jgi:phage-related protein